MKSEYIESELIDKFLKGELQDEELQAMQERIASDTDFAEKVENQRVFNAAFSDYELAKFHVKLNAYNPYKSASGLSWTKTGIVGAVVVAGLLSLGVYFSRDSSETVLKEGTEYVSISSQEIREEEKALLAIALGDDVQSNEEEEYLEDLTQLEKLDKGVVRLKTRNYTELNPVTDKNEPSYMVRKSEVNEEDVLVISSDHAKEILKSDAICNQLVLNVKIETTDACDENLGMISLNQLSMKGGKAPYQYALNEGSFQYALRFDGLASGKYTLKVRDAEGCVIFYHEKIEIESIDCQ